MFWCVLACSCPPLFCLCNLTMFSFLVCFYLPETLVPVMHVSPVSMETSRWFACLPANLGQSQRSSSSTGTTGPKIFCLPFIFTVLSPASGQRRDACINRYCRCLNAHRGLWYRCTRGRRCEVTFIQHWGACPFQAWVGSVQQGTNMLEHLWGFFGGRHSGGGLSEQSEALRGGKCVYRDVCGVRRWSVPQISRSWHRVGMDWWTRAVMLVLRAPLAFCPGFVLVVSCVKWFPQTLWLPGLFSWALCCVKRACFTAVDTGNAWCFLEEEKGFDQIFPLMWNVNWQSMPASFLLLLSSSLFFCCSNIGFSFFVWLTLCPSHHFFSSTGR